MDGKIFISYRRGDDPGFAGRLFDRLGATFQRHQLFMDVDDIPIGRDFAAHLTEQVGQCDVVLAIIGPHWLNARDEQGQRRLDDHQDFVRYELESGLDLGKRVIPVLVNGATMPGPEQLPTSLRSLTRRNAFRLSHERFGAEVVTLVESLEIALKEAADQREIAARASVLAPPAAAFVAPVATPVAQPVMAPQLPAPSSRDPSPTEPVATSLAGRADRYDESEGVNRPMTRKEAEVLFASSLGTVFEWYDFYLYGSLAAIIGAKFFAAYGLEARQLFALLAFGAGFIVRPIGAIVFGRMGDRYGRKRALFATMMIMGMSTFIVGILPTYESIGTWAPIILILTRILQGLALGGEYGGAITYVAEHAPANRRGFYTSWIQLTPTLGLFLSLMIITITRMWASPAEFNDFYWRTPFLLSGILLAISLWIRFSLGETPIFSAMLRDGATTRHPWREAFGTWRYLKIGIVCLFGLAVGQAVIWYTANFYTLFFLQSIAKVDFYTCNVLMSWALVPGSAFMIFFGWLSDKIGRKWLILGGCLLGAATMFLIFAALLEIANPKLAAAHRTVKVTLVADPAMCSNVFDPVGIRQFTTQCDLARRTMTTFGVPFSIEPAAPGTAVVVKMSGKTFPINDRFRTDFQKALEEVGYPRQSDQSIVKMVSPIDFSARSLGILALLTILLMYAGMVFGPMAAALAEMFPARIRYTAMTLPYHIGNGWFGGLLPASSFAMVVATGDIYFGLWYPVGFALLTVFVGVLFVPETYKQPSLNAQSQG